MSEEYWIDYWRTKFEAMTPEEFQNYRKAELRNELHTFEEKVPMTLSERAEVRKWVLKGNSVYRHVAYENGYEMNYLDALKTEN